MTTQTTLAAKPTKLRSGEWGATVSSTHVSVGDMIQVVAANGKTWTDTVGKVIWAGNGVTIVATRQRAAKTTGSSRGHDGCPTGGDCWSFSSIKHCWSCGK